MATRRVHRVEELFRELKDARTRRVSPLDAKKHLGRFRRDQRVAMRSRAAVPEVGESANALLLHACVTFVRLEHLSRRARPM